MSSLIDEILDPLRNAGQRAYVGEPVSVTDHLLQSAQAAEEDGAADSLVLAALLHDIGWVLRSGSRHHEERGADFLTTYFGPAVTEPVRLHVAAKRFLCTTDPDYHGSLSAASQRTLVRQGGVFDDFGLAAFRAEAFHAEAVRLRRYDDRAKLPGRPTSGLERYEELIAAYCR